MPTPRKKRPAAFHLGEHFPEWDGFIFTATGELQHPYWRRAFSAGDLKAMFYHAQQVTILEHENARLRAEIERAQAEQDAAQARAAWYRSQLVLESTHGAMLARITSRA